MVSEVLNSGLLYSVTLYGKYEIPSWTLIHFCHQTLINSLKMTTILKILNLIKSGKISEDFSIEIKPKELYPKFEDKLLSVVYN